MAVQSIEAGTRAFSDTVQKQGDALDPIAERLQGWLGAALAAGGPAARRAKDLLNGTWLGHRLHAAFSDAPIGAWTTALVLDAIGEHRAADAAIKFGVATAVPTAAAGLADWHDTQKTERGVGLLHALLNGAGLLCYVGSIVARGRARRGLGIGLSSLGYACAIAGGYLGGELTYRLGTNVNRTAWDPGGEGFQPVAHMEDLVEGKLLGAEIDVDGTKVPVVLLKRGHRIYALNGRCSHQGGPLAEGRIVGDDCVECPWHASVFDMKDGSVVHGPTSYPQPRFEARIDNGQVEVRPVK